jgi:signal transduction histidine kinase
MASADPSDLRRIVHDLRQPLGAIANRAFLLGDEPLTSEGRRHLAALDADVKRLAKQLEELSAAFDSDPSRG